MTAYDHWLNIGSDGPDDLDEDAFVESLETVAAEMYGNGDVDSLLETIYNAMPALNHALREVVFPSELRASIVALANRAADIRADVDDEYAARTSDYGGPDEG